MFLVLSVVSTLELGQPPPPANRPINRTYFCSYAYITFKSNYITLSPNDLFFQTLQFLE